MPGNGYVKYAEDQTLPGYIKENSVKFGMPDKLSLPEKPKCNTLFIDAGKKDKINKMEIVGSCPIRTTSKKMRPWLIEVKDFTTFAAVKKSKADLVLKLIEKE